MIPSTIRYLVPAMGGVLGPENIEMKCFLETPLRRRIYMWTDTCTRADRCCDTSCALFRQEGGGSQLYLM